MGFALIERCIYCAAAIDPARGSGDHVIPDAFGRFIGGLRFRRLCRDCNSRVGRAEETLIRSSPEAFMRRYVEPALPKTGRGKRGRGGAAASGGGRPTALISRDGWTELVEPTAEDPNTVNSVDQLVFRDTHGVEDHKKLSPDMSPGAMRRIVDGVPNWTEFRLLAEDNFERYERLLADAGFQMVSKSVVRDEGLHREPGYMRFRFDPMAYYRAVAKIAFHYYLAVNARGLRGDEPEFAAIRRFIMCGDIHPAEFFEVDGPRFLTPFGKLPDGRAVTNAHWLHMLGAYDQRRHVVVQVMLFIGPRHLPHSLHVRLGAIRSPILLPTPAQAHIYEYHESAGADGASGVVYKANTSRVA